MTGMQSAEAAPITLNGLTFDDSIGAGVEITGGDAGAGSRSDPIVLRETVTGTDVTISIGGLPNFGNQTGSLHQAGFFLLKEVTNMTGAVWNFFDHELQETLGVASEDGDGLSFAQGCATCRPWDSDVFDNYVEELTSRDFINFFDGTVAVGETVTFLYAITDNSPLNTFYLRQRPNFNAQNVPEPGTFGLLGLGLIGLGLTAHRRRRQAA